MARPKTIHKPNDLSVKVAQINKVEQALANEADATFFSEDLAHSVLSVNSDVDISEDLKAEPTKSIAELLDDTVAGVSLKSPKTKKKKVTNEEKETVETQDNIQEEAPEIENAQD